MCLAWIGSRKGAIVVSLNPIEEAFSKVKGIDRKVGARTRGTLDEAIGEALSAVTSEDAAGWFVHCGYRALDQPL